MSYTSAVIQYTPNHTYSGPTFYLNLLIYQIGPPSLRPSPNTPHIIVYQDCSHGDGNSGFASTIMGSHSSTPSCGNKNLLGGRTVQVSVASATGMNSRMPKRYSWVLR
jgi:hypothetical protein